MPLEWKKASKLDEIYMAAVEQCKYKGEYNLVLAYELPVAVLESDFVAQYNSTFTNSSSFGEL
jgi:hypothetical protein